MRKRIFGRKLKRTKNQRKALFRSLIRSFILYGGIKTTEAKAKAVRGNIEKMVTVAKELGSEARPRLMKDCSMEIADKLIHEVAPRFTERKGGYTRIIKIGPRLNDNASMVFMEWVEGEEIKNKKDSERGREKKTKEASRKGSEKETKEEKNAKANKTNKKK